MNGIDWNEMAKDLLKKAVNEIDTFKKVDFLENGDVALVTEELFGGLPTAPWLDVCATIHAKDLAEALAFDCEEFGMQDEKAMLASCRGFIESEIEMEMYNVERDCRNALRGLCAEIPEMVEEIGEEIGLE